MEPATRHRPGGITLIVVLAVIDSVATIMGGLFLAIDQNDKRLVHDSGMSPNHLLAGAIGLIVLGFIGLFVALALGRGSRIARLLFGIWAVLTFAGGVYSAISLTGEQRATGAVQAAIGLVVVYLLYGSEKDREFFLA